MKHTTIDSMKFKRLTKRLGLPRYAVAGLLEMLWQATVRNAPRGDIGKFDNEAIAIELDWDGDPDELIRHMIDTGWLDEHADHRLVVHDWADHAPAFVHRNISRKGGFCVPSRSPDTSICAADMSDGDDHLSERLTCSEDAQAGTCVNQAGAYSTKSALSGRLLAQNHVKTPTTKPNQTKPPPPTPPQATAVTPTGDLEEEEVLKNSWRAVDAALAECGMGNRSSCVDRCRRAISPDEALAVIEHWRSHPGWWDVGALYSRLVNAHSSLPTDGGWPAAKQPAQSSRGRPKPPDFERWRADQVKRAKAEGGDVPNDEQLQRDFAAFVASAKRVTR